MLTNKENLKDIYMLVRGGYIQFPDELRPAYSGESVRVGSVGYDRQTGTVRFHLVDAAGSPVPGGSSVDSLGNPLLVRVRASVVECVKAADDRLGNLVGLMEVAKARGDVSFSDPKPVVYVGCGDLRGSVVVDRVYFDAGRQHLCYEGVSDGERAYGRLSNVNDAGVNNIVSAMRRGMKADVAERASGGMKI